MRVILSEILGFKEKHVFKTIVLLIHCETSFNFFFIESEKNRKYILENTESKIVPRNSASFTY